MWRFFTKTRTIFCKKIFTTEFVYIKRWITKTPHKTIYRAQVNRNWTRSEPGEECEGSSSAGRFLISENWVLNLLKINQILKWVDFSSYACDKFVIGSPGLQTNYWPFTLSFCHRVFRYVGANNYIAFKRLKVIGIFSCYI